MTSTLTATPTTPSTTSTTPPDLLDRDLARLRARRDLLPTSTTPADLLRDRDAAALCAVSTATWWRWDAAAKCPAPVRVGHVTRWRAAELRDWIEAGCPERAEWEARRAARRGR